MSELKTNKVSPATGTALAVGDSGDTITIPSGATLTVAGSLTLPDDSVTTAKILDNNVTLAKLDDGTQGDILYYAASGAPTRLAKGSASQTLKMNSGATAPEEVAKICGTRAYPHRQSWTAGFWLCSHAQDIAPTSVLVGDMRRRNLPY